MFLFLQAYLKCINVIHVLMHMCQTQGPGAKSGPWWI